jgi:hypothetical protein
MVNMDISNHLIVNTSINIPLMVNMDISNHLIVNTSINIPLMVNTSTMEKRNMERTDIGRTRRKGETRMPVSL